MLLVQGFLCLNEVRTVIRITSVPGYTVLRPRLQTAMRTTRSYFETPYDLIAHASIIRSFHTLDMGAVSTTIAQP